MRKIICACLVLLTVCMAYTCANAQQQRKSTVVTYFPAPKADYKTVRLDPTNEPATASGAGQMYYNASPSTDKIRYYKKDHWADLGGGASSSPVDHIPPKDVGPVSPKTGQAYYDNVTDVIKYINKTGTWINMAADQYWTESSFKPATASDPAHYNIYLMNHTNRRVGIGTDNPQTALHVVYNDTNDPNESSPRMAMFDKLYTNTGADQFLSIYMYPNGTNKFPAYKDSSVQIYATGPDEHFKFAALNQSGFISFNVGGYNSSATEIMRLSNPGGASNPNPRVGVGNSSLPFALFIDSEMNATSVFAARQVANGQGSLYNKGGFWNLIPYSDTLYMAYGVYCKSEDDWYVDRFKMPDDNTLNDAGAKIAIIPGAGIRLTKVGSFNSGTGGDVDWDSKIWGWQLFDEDGKLNENVIKCPKAGYCSLDEKKSTLYAKALFDEVGAYEGTKSSRVLKENFTPLDQDDILDKIDQLEVSRWNYIGDSPSVTRIGPVAEDFYRLFKTSDSEHGLQPMDSAGVSLAGVKALSCKINSQQQQLQELQAAIKDIRSQIGLRRGGLR